MAATAVMLGMVTGCESGLPQAKSKTDVPPSAQVRPDMESDSNDVGDALDRPVQSALVAPVFHHGDGVGAYGCIVVSPPVFLSEEEARDVIEDELEKFGLKFKPDAFKVDGITIPGTTWELEYGLLDPTELNEETRRTITDLTKTISVDLDGFDENAYVAYEFISMNDDYLLRPKTNALSSVEHFLLVRQAESLVERLATRNIPTAAVFYDPIQHLKRDEQLSHLYFNADPELTRLKKIIDAFESVPPEERNVNPEYLEAKKQTERIEAEIMKKYQEAHRRIMKASHDDLRAQAHDFGEWLVAQGIVPPRENPDGTEDTEKDLDP